MKNPLARKIVAIAVAHAPDTPDVDRLYALADDGSLWRYRFATPLSSWEWKQFPPLPDAVACLARPEGPDWSGRNAPCSQARGHEGSHRNGQREW